MSAPEQALENRISEILAPLGYSLVFAEFQKGRGRVLRLFIEFLDAGAGAISLDDCAKVSRALDEPLDQSPEVDAVFDGPYTLEVSSPGLDRPLRRLGDFDRFKGQEVRIHVFRPLSADEIGNAVYQQKNPKQKTFLGTLLGFESGNKIVLDVSASFKAGESKIWIPHALISKANIEPKFE